MPILLRRHGILGRTLVEGFDGFAIHLASHENVAAALSRENRFGRFRLGGARAVEYGLDVTVPVCANPSAALKHAARVTDRGRLTIWPPCCYLNTRHKRWKIPFFCSFLGIVFAGAAGVAVEPAAWPAAWRAARRATGSAGTCPSPLRAGNRWSARRGRTAWRPAVRYPSRQPWSCRRGRRATGTRQPARCQRCRPRIASWDSPA